MLTRRGVIGAAAVGGALVAVGGCTTEQKPSFNPRDWLSVRGQFRLSSGYAQMAAFIFASHPAPVREAIERHRRGLDTDPVGYLEAHEAEYDAAVYAAAARYLQSEPGRIACTDSTTMGLGLLYTGLNLAPGDEILTTEHDFYATHEALRLLAARDGVTVRKVKLFADPATASIDEIVGNLRRALTRRTKVVAVTWVHSSTGIRLPIEQMAEVVRTVDALLCVDGVHGLGAVDVTPDQLRADFLISGGHKWLFGPRGTGIIWGSERGWSRYAPVIPTFDRNAIGNWISNGARPVPPGSAATPGGYHSFEHRWALAQAFEFHLTIGRSAIATRTAGLALQLKEGLADISGVTVKTPMTAELSAGLVCCEIAGVSAAQATDRLRNRKISASVTPYAQSYLRFGTSVVTDEGDVDRVLEAITGLA